MFLSSINKWSVRQAAKSNVKGNWESREIQYGADMNYAFENFADIPQTTKNLSIAKINSEATEDRSTHFQSHSNFDKRSNQSTEGLKYKENKSITNSPNVSISMIETSPAGYQYFSFNDPKKKKYQKPTIQEIDMLFNPELDQRKLDK